MSVSLVSFSLDLIYPWLACFRLFLSLPFSICFSQYLFSFSLDSVSVEVFGGAHYRPAADKQLGMCLTHRRVMLFWLFRILYGRMKHKTGSKTQGKSASGTRMSIVLRFLAGTQPEEIQFFLDLLSEPVKHFKDGRSLLPPYQKHTFVVNLWRSWTEESLCCEAATSHPRDVLLLKLSSPRTLLTLGVPRVVRVLC